MSGKMLVEESQPCYVSRVPCCISLL